MAENNQDQTNKQVENATTEKTSTTAAKSTTSGAKTSKPRKPRIVSATKVEDVKDGKVTIKKDAKVADHITEDPDEAVIVVKADHEETKASKQLANTLRNAYGQIQARKSNKANEAAERAAKAEGKLKEAEEEKLKAEAEAAKKSEEETTEEEKTEEVKEEQKDKKNKNQPPKNFAELMSVLSDFDDEEEEEKQQEQEEQQEEPENSKDKYAGYALADDYKQSLENEQDGGIQENEDADKKEKGSIFKKRVKNTKKDGEYKPPFYQNFKFWAIVVAALCVVALITVIIISSVNNSRSRYPQGFIFETQQGGRFTEQSEGDIYVYNTVSQTNGVRVRVKFDGNFNGNIVVSIVQSGIAEIEGAVDNKKTISNGETITIKPKYIPGTGDIREAVGGLTHLEARYDSVYERMSILFDKQLSDIKISAKMSADDEEALRGYEKKYYVSRELTLDAETYYGQFSPGYKADAYGRTIYWASSNPNIATVDSEGHVTSYRAGTVEFYARAQEYYSPDNISTIKRNSQKFEITFSDIPVESITLRGDDVEEHFALWLSDPEALTIDLKECINIATDGKKAPLNFSADYLYENAVLDYFVGYDKVDVNISKNLGAGVFELYDTETSHEGQKLHLNVKFGDDPLYSLSAQDSARPIKVGIHRSKNYAVKLRDRNKDTVSVEFLSFDNVETGRTVLYTDSSLNYLFDGLEIKERTTNLVPEEKTVNNFDILRDIAFVAEDPNNGNFFELRREDSGYWYFVPKKDCLTAAITDAEGFIIRAYLRDINNKENPFAEIPYTELGPLTIKVVAPNPSSNSVLISGQSIIANAIYDVSKAAGERNLYEEFLTTIANNRADGSTNTGLSKISIAGATIHPTTISWNDLFSENNVPTAKKVYLKLSSRNDNAIYAGKETGKYSDSTTKVGLHDDKAVVGSVHYLTLDFIYVYDIDLTETGRPTGSLTDGLKLNEEVIKSIQIRIRVTK